VINRVVEIQRGYISAIALYATNLKVGQVALHWQPSQAIDDRIDHLKWQAKSYARILDRHHLPYKSRAEIIHITINPQ